MHNVDITCIYHAKCLDGLAAAAAVLAIHAHEEINFVAAEHGKPLPDIPPGDILYVVDFSLSPDGYAAMSQQFEKVITLDHHAGSEAVIKWVSTQHPNCKHLFDTSMSGAEVVCKYFGSEVPELIALIGDRDTWKWKLAGTKAVTAWLFGHMPTTPKEMLDLIVEFDVNREFHHSVITWGDIKGEVDDTFVDDICKRAFARDLHGMAAICVYTPVLKSEVGNKLLKLHPECQVAITIDPDGTEEASLSFRSLDGKSALEMSRHFSGGGHGNAAGGKGFLSTFSE